MMLEYPRGRTFPVSALPNMSRQGSIIPGMRAALAIKKNLRIFETENLRERSKANPFVDSLSEHARVPDAAELGADLDYVGEKTNPAVEKLMKWRHNFFGHRSVKPILSTPLRVFHAISGSAKGFYTIGVLEEIKAMLKAPLHTKFDLVYGTSTGAI